MFETFLILQIIQTSNAKRFNFKNEKNQKQKDDQNHEKKIYKSSSSGKSAFAASIISLSYCCINV